jgi:hypothetical protein
MRTPAILDVGEERLLGDLLLGLEVALEGCDFSEKRDAMGLALCRVEAEKNDQDHDRNILFVPSRSNPRGLCDLGNVGKVSREVCA